MRFVFHPASAFSYVGVALCWALVWALTGPLWTTALTFALGAIAVWGIYAALKARKHPEFLGRSEKDALFSVTYSVTGAVVLLVTLPYLLFHESFLNIYVVAWIYLLPVFVLSFALAYATHHYFSDDLVRIVPSLLFGLVSGVVVMIVVTAGLFVFLTDIEQRSAALPQVDVSVRIDTFSELEEVMDHQGSSEQVVSMFSLQTRGLERAYMYALLHTTLIRDATEQFESYAASLQEGSS